MLQSTFSFRALLAVALLGLGFVGTAHAQAPARTVGDTVPLAADGEVTVENHEGSITVTTWDRNQVRFEAEIMPTDEDPDAQKTTVQVQSRDDRLRLATKHKEGDDESVVFGFDEDGFRWGGINIPAVHYTLKLPRTAALTIDDHESTIEVTGLAGPLQINSHEGAIAVAEQRAEVTIDSHESPITITDQKGDVTLDTHAGRMEVREMSGRLSVDTHDGELAAEALKGGLRFEAHDGSARVTFARFSDDVFADTHDGDVTLTLPSNAGFDLNTDLDEDGDVTSDFDLSSLRVTDEDEEDVVNYRGEVNGGGPEIRFESQDGDLTLRTP